MLHCLIFVVNITKLLFLFIFHLLQKRIQYLCKPDAEVACNHFNKISGFFLQKAIRTESYCIDAICQGSVDQYQNLKPSSILFEKLCFAGIIFWQNF